MSYLEIATLALLPAFLALDFVVRGRELPEIKGWRTRAFLVTAFNFGLALAIGIGWGAAVGDATLFDLSGLGALGGAAVGILVYELIHYGYHRAAHRFDVLWRWHQTHHSAERLDAFGAYFLHPIDNLLFTSFASLVFFPLLGVAPLAGGLAAAFLTFNALFQHANVHTPRWLGYLIQRPESHLLHHARDRHRNNYADLPLWDMVFGTFHNPTDAEVEGVGAGFYDGASARLGEMLLLRPVHEPPQAEPEPQPLSLAEPIRQAEARARAA